MAYRRAERGLKALCSLPFTAEAGAKHPFKRQLHTAHVGTGGWETRGSSSTACAGKVDHRSFSPISARRLCHAYEA